METNMKVDGQDTGVKLDLDLNYIFKAVVVAAIIGFGTYLFQIKDDVRYTRDQMNDKLNTITTQSTLTNYKLEQMEKKSDSYVTVEQLNQRSKVRDIQFSTIDARINALEVKVGAKGSK